MLLLLLSGMVVSGTPPTPGEGGGIGVEEDVVDVRLFGMIQGGRDEVLPFSLLAGVLKQLLCCESLESKESRFVSAQDKT